MQPTPAQLRALARRDPALGAAMRRVPRFPGFPAAAQRHMRSHFHALGRAIVSQQLATKAARAIHDRLCELTPSGRFPTPDELLALRRRRLRGAGLSRAKTESLRDLAGRVRDGHLVLRCLGRLSDDEVVARLVQVYGIGLWSAQMFLLFRLGRLDVMPATDLGVREGVRRLDGLVGRPTPQQVLDRARPWSPLRSVASWVLWRLLDA